MTDARKSDLVRREAADTAMLRAAMDSRRVEMETADWVRIDIVNRANAAYNGAIKRIGAREQEARDAYFESRAERDREWIALYEEEEAVSVRGALATGTDGMEVTP